MIKPESHMALERERERETLLTDKFFERRILLSMPQISKKIDKVIAGIDCITISVCKRTLMAI